MSLLSFFDQKKKNNRILADYPEMAAKLSALNASQAIIEFDLKGQILTANKPFLDIFGYCLSDITGQHHSLFVLPQERNTTEYKNFWIKIAQGASFEGEQCRVNKAGQAVWVKALYLPLLNAQGRPYKVIKIASNITQAKIKENDNSSQISAIQSSQAIIEFDLKGNILSANSNFLTIMGYRLEEIKGRHHSIFISEKHAKTEQYKDFWIALEKGQFITDEFQRFTKNGKSVWIQASYNPIFDMDGKPYKVVKYAYDITQQKIKSANYQGQINAIGQSQGIIEFDLEGNILSANNHFLSTIGYTLDDLQGKQHSILLPPEEEQSREYQGFWRKLKSGEFISGEFKLLKKDNSEIWMSSFYNPIADPAGKIFKVVTFTSNITESKLNSANYSGQIKAISASQAVIEFNMDGTIITANDNFCAAIGYKLSEIQGKKHSFLVESSYKDSREYNEFWKKLNQGLHTSGEFKRITKSGAELWIQASYNPIFDLNGKPFKVVKYAIDVTDQKNKNANYEGQIAAISKSQAVIEFNMDGTIITANENFLEFMQYSLKAIKGKKHAIFVEKQYRDSKEYALFWEQLRSGQYSSGQYLRIDSKGQDVWIQASYNPIFGLNGKPFKVVKYAVDITPQKAAVNAVNKSLLALSRGDVNAVITEDLSGEFLPLKHAVNITLKRLGVLVADITAGANHVSSSAREVQSGSIDLSQRTEEQAASLEQMVATMEELTETVNKNSENATVASQLATVAASKAEAGGAVVSRAITAMDYIETSSNKIAAIISVIDEIAFQTNLLALNAAVEAARAGEQGRGFAVVAGEVRNLAQRSAGAAKEIKSLIKDSVDKVADGTRLVNESGQTLGNIVEAIKQASQLIADINLASKEQAEGITQVNSAVAQMDGMTQQNAAMVEEATAASASMSNQADNLLLKIDFFKVSKSI